jgi:hypothetical protein
VLPNVAKLRFVVLMETREEKGSPTSALIDRDPSACLSTPSRPFTALTGNGTHVLTEERNWSSGAGNGS